MTRLTGYSFKTALRSTWRRPLHPRQQHNGAPPGFDDSGQRIGKPRQGSGAGGGIFSGLSALIERSTVARNRAGAVTGGGANGGGLAVWDGDVILRNSTVSGNVVEGSSPRAQPSWFRAAAARAFLSSSPPSSATRHRASCGLQSESSWTAPSPSKPASSREAATSSALAHLPRTASTSSGPSTASITTQCGLDNPSDVLTQPVAPASRLLRRGYLHPCPFAEHPGRFGLSRPPTV